MTERRLTIAVIALALIGVASPQPRALGLGQTAVSTPPTAITLDVDATDAPRRSCTPG